MTFPKRLALVAAGSQMSAAHWNLAYDRYGWALLCAASVVLLLIVSRPSKETR